MTCKNCCYYYSDVNERTGKPVTRQYCHYLYNDGFAPCEIDETQYQEPDED